MELDVKFKLNNIKNYNLNLELTGLYLKYETDIYFISTHHGYSIDKIIVNNNILNNFTICNWNEIVFSKINKDSLKDQFVFNSLSIKQIDSETTYFVDDIELKFIKNEYLPINMLPDNPTNLYYKMKTPFKCRSGNSGKPIYNTKKQLIGILAKEEDEYIYVIPSYYILKSLTKNDNNNIYYFEFNNTIKKINKYIIKENNIYHNSLKTTIPLDTYLTLEGDKQISCIVECTQYKNRFIQYKKYLPKILNCQDFNIKNKTIKCTSSFLRYLKEIENDILIDNFNNIIKHKRFSIKLKNITYNIIFN